MSVGTDYGKQTSTVNQREKAEKEYSNSGKVTHGDFLKLLTKQLTTQDPLNPMQDIDFTAQLAQLQALDEQMAMTKTMKSLRADTQMQAGTQMIGKFVSGTDASGANASGLVSKVVQTSDGVFCELANKQRVPVENISNVWNDANSMNNDIANSGQFIGMWIEAGYDSAAQPIRGIVQKVQLNTDGQVVLTLYGGQKVTWDKVTELRLPSEAEKLLYTLPDEVRSEVERAQGMVDKGVTGKTSDGKEISGIVAGARVDENNKVILVLYDGSEFALDDIVGDPRQPTAEDATNSLRGYWAEGIDEEGGDVSGIIVGAVEDEEGLAVILDDGSKIYFDAILKLADATDDQKGRLHGMYAEGVDADGNVVSGYIVKKLEVDGKLAVRLSTGAVVLCEKLTLVREPIGGEIAESEQAVEDAKNNG